MKHDEDLLTSKIARAIRKQYNCMVHIDKSEGGRSYAAGNLFKAASDNEWPDINVCKPSAIYHGLYLETKAEHGKLINTNGTWKRGSEDHHVFQHKRHLELIAAGYYCCFVWSLPMALMIASKYFADERLYPDCPIWNGISEVDRNNALADEFFKNNLTDYQQLTK